LILFDSYPMPEHAKPDYSDKDAVWRDVALGASLKLDAQVAQIDAKLFRQIALKQGHLYGEFSENSLSRIVDQLARNTHLLPTAQLTTYKGDVILYTAMRGTSNLDRSGANPRLWDPLVSGQIDIIPIDAEHHQMLSPSAIRQIGLLPV